ncbi:MAG TPA: diacylglycerol kinase family protein [Thermoanaerobaculia bacterium]|nr:diacylglycerol kinase family protein [Thermoanaerobaculia bacterium]
MRSASLIYNPAAGRHKLGARVPALLEALGASGFAAQALPTTGPGHATLLASERAAAGDEAVFAFGGDGTVREAAAGLLDSTTALGILPGGTTNVLARALRLPLDPLAVARAAGSFRSVPLDVGLCASPDGNHPFLMMVSCGLDAWLLETLDPRWKRTLGRIGIGLQGLAAWWRYGYPEIEIEAGGQRFTASLVAACNIDLYGGSYRIAPAARSDDGRLELVLFHGKTRAATLVFALALTLGRHVRRHNVRILAVEGDIRIKLPPGTCAQIDGDAFGGCRELTLSISTEKLRVLAP